PRDDWAVQFFECPHDVGRVDEDVQQLFSAVFGRQLAEPQKITASGKCVAGARDDKGRWLVSLCDTYRFAQCREGSFVERIPTRGVIQHHVEGVTTELDSRAHCAGISRNIGPK